MYSGKIAVRPGGGGIRKLLFIELYVAWQLREGIQFSHKGKIRSSSIGQFD
jgi:hypothetical protein